MTSEEEQPLEQPEVREEMEEEQEDDYRAETQTKKVICINWRSIISFFMMISWVMVFRFLPITQQGQLNPEQIKNLDVLARDPS